MSATQQALRSFTPAELEAAAAKSLIAVRSRVYDVSAFVARHPGGSGALRLAAGRDVSVLFEACHPTGAGLPGGSVSGVLGSKLVPCVGVLLSDEAPERSSPPDAGLALPPPHGAGSEQAATGFYAVLCARVGAHLRARHTTQHHLGWLQCVDVLLVFGVLALLTYVYARTLAWWPLLVVGFVLPRYGYLAHSGSHEAVVSGRSRFRWLNVAMANLFNVGWALPVWNIEHVASHHQVPNDVGGDPDLAAGMPFLRLHPGQPLRWWHRYNVAFFLVGPLALGLLAVQLRTFLQTLLRRVPAQQGPYFEPRWKAFLVPLFAGLTQYGPYLLLPLWLHPTQRARVCWQFFALLVQMAAVMYHTLIVNHVQPFQLDSHNKLSPLQSAAATSSGSKRAKKAAPRKQQVVTPSTATNTTSTNTTSTTATTASPAQHWAVTQLLESANYSCDSFWATYWTNGLNCQIEHHLFPSMSPYLFPEIAPIVRATALEFGLPYHSYPSWAAASWSMHRWLVRLGGMP